MQQRPTDSRAHSVELLALDARDFGVTNEAANSNCGSTGT